MKTSQNFPTFYLPLQLKREWKLTFKPYHCCVDLTYFNLKLINSRCQASPTKPSSFTQFNNNFETHEKHTNRSDLECIYNDIPFYKVHINNRKKEIKAANAFPGARSIFFQTF